MKINDDAHILNNCGLIDDIKKTNTGLDNNSNQKKRFALYFFKTPNKVIKPEACNIDENCSDPTTSPIAIMSSPAPDNLVE